MGEVLRASAFGLHSICPGPAHRQVVYKQNAWEGCVLLGSDWVACFGEEAIRRLHHQWLQQIRCPCAIAKLQVFTEGEIREKLEAILLSLVCMEPVRKQNDQACAVYLYPSLVILEDILPHLYPK